MHDAWCIAPAAKLQCCSSLLNHIDALAPTRPSPLRNLLAWFPGIPRSSVPLGHHQAIFTSVSKLRPGHVAVHVIEEFVKFCSIPWSPGIVVQLYGLEHARNTLRYVFPWPGPRPASCEMTGAFHLVPLLRQPLAQFRRERTSGQQWAKYLYKQVRPLLLSQPDIWCARILCMHHHHHHETVDSRVF